MKSNLQFFHKNEAKHLQFLIVLIFQVKIFEEIALQHLQNIGH